MPVSQTNKISNAVTTQPPAQSVITQPPKSGLFGAMNVNDAAPISPCVAVSVLSACIAAPVAAYGVTVSGFTLIGASCIPGVASVSPLIGQIGIGMAGFGCTALTCDAIGVSTVVAVGSRTMRDNEMQVLVDVAPKAKTEPVIFPEKT